MPPSNSDLKAQFALLAHNVRHNFFQAMNILLQALQRMEKCSGQGRKISAEFVCCFVNADDQDLNIHFVDQTENLKDECDVAHTFAMCSKGHGVRPHGPTTTSTTSALPPTAESN